MTRRLLATKIVVIGLGLALLATSGASFYASRRLPEPVVLGAGVTSVKQLADYFEPLRGTANDCHVFMLQGKAPGATMLVLGGSHPEEPAGRLVSWILAENAVVETGRLIVVLSANRSASTVTRLGGAYPPDFTIATEWGSRTFRMGDRWTNPLDQWPDPEVYFHYPSGQQLAYVDIRNVNRAWPGRANGTLISTIVTHQRGQDMASMVSMVLTDMEGFKIGTEFSPRTLHGLSHREIGDHSQAVSLLFEAPQPFLDATRGVTSREQLLTGKDEFVVKAGQHGLLFEKIDEKGWPIDVRVGRHTSTLLQVAETWSEDHPAKRLVVTNVPKYKDVIEKTVGHYLHDPAKAATGRVVYE
jgi:hypothetical protein